MPKTKTPVRRPSATRSTKKAAPKKAVPKFERQGLTDAQLVQLLRTMITHRTLESRGFQLNRQGKIPFASAGEGHEAVQAGAAMAFLRGSDVLVPYYRDWASTSASA